MLTRKSTLNALWDKNPTNDYSRVREIFNHYANPTKTARLFHWGRTTANQTAIKQVIADYSARDAQDQSPESLLTAIINATPNRNPNGELQHRIDDVSDRLNIAVETYSDDDQADFLKVITASIDALDVSAGTTEGIRNRLETILSANDHAQGRIVITIANQLNAIVSIGYQDKTKNNALTFMRIQPEVILQPTVVPTLTSGSE